jgi:hypothetical protein
MAAGWVLAGVGTAVLVVVVVVRRLGAPAAPVRGGSGSSGPVQAGPVRAAQRRGTAVHWIGLAVGVALAVPLGRWDGLGRGPMLAVPVATLVLLVSVAAGQVGLRAPGTGVRTASLQPRRLGDYLPRRLTGAVLVGLTWLLAVLAGTTWGAAPDDLGRAGRSLVSYGIDPGTGAACSSTRSPWPGSFYSAPIGLVVVAGLLVAWAVLRLVTLRPRLGGEGPATDDDQMRRQAAGVVVASVGVLVAVPALGVEATAAAALTATGCGTPAWWPVAGWALAVTALPTLTLLGGCLAQLLLPRLGRPATTPTGPAPAGTAQ